MFILLHKIRRATHPKWGAVEHIGTYYFGINVLVDQQLLNGADVLAPHRPTPLLPPAKTKSAKGRASGGRAAAAAVGMTRPGALQAFE
jgi:hypothetical protein